MKMILDYFARIKKKKVLDILVDISYITLLIWTGVVICILLSRS